MKNAHYDLTTNQDKGHSHQYYTDISYQFSKTSPLNTHIRKIVKQHFDEQLIQRRIVLRLKRDIHSAKENITLSFVFYIR